MLQLHYLGLLLAHALLITCLPTIFEPYVAHYGLDTATITWTPKGDLTGNYRFIIRIKEHKDLYNPNIQALEREVDKSYNTITISGLKSGTAYSANITAAAFDSSSEGSTSVQIAFQTTGVKPPTSLDITTITDTSVTFEWTPPVGVQVDATTIHLINNDNKDKMTYPEQASPITEFTINNLKPGTPYVIEIQAKKGNMLSTIVRNGLRTAVGTISRVRLDNVTPTTATAHWDQPVDHKNHKVSRYEVGLIKDAGNTNTQSKATLFFTPSNKPDILKYEFTDLIPGRYYGVKVRVVYEVNGHGPWSEISFFETKFQEKPAAPTKPVLSQATKVSIKITWAAPTNFKDIIDYEIEYAKKSERPFPTVQTQGANTEYIITELESGTTYTAKVRAIGKHNIQGEWSVENTFKTDGPKPVSSLTVTEITDKNAKVTWTTYTGEKPDKFLVYHKVTDSDEDWKKNEVDNNTLFFTLQSLEPTSPYKIKVIAVKGSEESSPKLNGLRTNINIDIAAQKPDNFQLKMTSPTNLQVSFTKVPNRVVKFYKVEVRGFVVANIPFIRSAVWPAKLSLERQTGTFKDMESGWKYQVRARAIYLSNEEGEWSTPRSVETEGPRPPRFVDIIDIKDTQATVTWKSGYESTDKKPASLQYSIKLYHLTDDNQEVLEAEFRANEDQSQHTFVGKTKAAMRYKVIIISHGDTGDGKGMTESTPKSKGFRSNSARPEAPRFKKVEVSGTQATVTWSNIPGRHDIKHYNVNIKQLGGPHVIVEQYKTPNGLTSQYTFTKLNKGSFYEVRVSGVVDEIIGKWMIQTFFVPDAEIKKVENTRLIKTTAHSAIITWNIGQRPDLKMYEIFLESRERGLKQTITTSSLTNSFKIEDLHPRTSYTYKVRAVSYNENEKGPWSEPKTFTTEDAGVLGTGLSTGVVVGIVLAILAFLILTIIVVKVYRKRRNNQQFEKFDGSVKFQKNGNGINNDGAPQEMDDTSAAIRNGKKLYI